MAKKIDYASMYTLRKDGRYMGYWHDSKGIRHSVYDRDPERLYAKIQENERPKAITFKYVAEKWQDEHWKEIGPGTQSSYNAILRQAIIDHGNYALKDVTAGEVNRILLREEAQNRSYKHAATVKSIYKSIFNYAIVNGYVENNPVRDVTVPRGMQKGHREAPENNVIDIIRKNVDAPFGLFPYFLLYTGFRAGEAVAVQWGDIDFKKKTITCCRAAEMHGSTPSIKPPKTEAGNRTIPLLDALSEQLERPNDAKDCDLVFPGENEKIMTRSALRSRWITWCRAVGLAEPVTVTRKHSKKKIEYKAIEWRPKLTAHQLRHGYCTILYEAGIDELTAMELMGHSDYETTRRIYTHLRQSHLDGVADKLNSQFAKATVVNNVVNKPN